MWWHERQRRRVMNALGNISHCPMGLVDVLRSHCVDELGSIYLYLPNPRTCSAQSAWAWLEAMRIVGAVRSGPYRIQADTRSERMKITHPDLYKDNPNNFEVYRIDRDRLTKLFDVLSEKQS